jgi:uncharacterized protein
MRRIIDSHPPGAFCWLELYTSDQNAAKSFYNSLFGWTANDMPMGPNDVYTMFQLEGRDAGAACTLRPEMKAQGVPPHWRLYIAVASVDESAKRVTELGGKVIIPPFDVFDAGRMAVVQDPTGAFFSLWQKMTHSGLGIAGVPGTLCWADLMTPDTERAKSFYEGLLGWKISKSENDPSGYLHIKNGEEFIGGIPPSHFAPPNTPPHWMAYIYVTNCDETTAKCSQLGGKTVLAPMAIEKVGRMSILADPQGAVFSAFTPEGPAA